MGRIMSVAEEFLDGVVCPSCGAGGRIDLEVVHCMEEFGWGDLKGGDGGVGGGGWEDVLVSWVGV